MTLALALVACAPGPDGVLRLAPDAPAEAPPEVAFDQDGVGFEILADGGWHRTLQLRRDDGSVQAIPLDAFGRGRWRPDPCVDLDQHQLPVELSLDGHTWWAQDVDYQGYLDRSGAVTLATGPAVACGRIGPDAAVTLVLTGYEAAAYHVEVDAPISVRVAFQGRANVPAVTIAPVDGLTAGHVALVDQGPSYVATLQNQTDQVVDYVWSMWLF